MKLNAHCHIAWKFLSSNKGRHIQDRFYWQFVKTTLTGLYLCALNLLSFANIRSQRHLKASLSHPKSHSSSDLSWARTTQKTFCFRLHLAAAAASLWMSDFLKQCELYFIFHSIFGSFGDSSASAKDSFMSREAN